MNPLVRDAILAAAVAYGVAPATVLSRDRRRTIAHARQEVMLALRNAGWSFPRIGRALDRDHRTVMAGVRAARDRRPPDAHTMSAADHLVAADTLESAARAHRAMARKMDGAQRLREAAAGGTAGVVA